MYWSNYAPGDNSAIVRSEMDGSNPVAVVTQLRDPCGLAIDISSSRLYWAGGPTGNVQSSNLGGGNILTLVQASSAPYGIAITHQKLFWSPDNSTLQSSNVDGSNIRTVFIGPADIRLLAVPD